MRANILGMALITGLGMTGADEALAVFVNNEPMLTIEWMDSDSGGHAQQFSLTPTGNGTYAYTIEGLNLCFNDVCGGLIDELHVDLDTDPYINFHVGFSNFGPSPTTVTFTVIGPLTLPDGAFNIVLEGNVDEMVDGGSDGVSFTPATLFDGITGPFGGMVTTSTLTRTWGTDTSVTESNICPTCSYTGATFATAIGFTGSGGGDRFFVSSRFSVTPASSSIPEPATLALLGFGLAGFGFQRRRVS